MPFCAHRCGYCNFTVIAGRNDLIDKYLTAIERELSWLETPRPVDTIYVGGGTPSQLSKSQLIRLFNGVLTWFPLRRSGEFSVEVNPVDVNDEMLDVFIEFDVNRVSLGSQTFQPAKLELLERDHTSDTIVDAVQLIQAGIKNISLDLIFGVPGETMECWSDDLAQAIRLAPRHISTYGLTFERGTQFWNRRLHGELSPIDEQLDRELYELAIDSLQAHKFEHYEVSNFAQPSYRCRHNEVYWSGRGYYAAGPGAARYVNGRRETNHRSVSTYLKRVLQGQSAVYEYEELSAEQAARERLVFGLRRLEGIDASEFEQQTGYAPDRLIAPALEQFLNLRLLEIVDNRIRLTREGLMVSDSLWPDFLQVEK